MSEQTDISEFTPELTTETITRTIVCPLRTNQRKTEILQQGISECGEMMQFVADHIPSFPEYEWSGRNNQIDSILKREFNDRRTVYAHVRQQTIHEVVDTFNSWKAKGKPGNRPRFEDSEYVPVRNGSGDELILEENDGAYGIRAQIITGDPVWFRIQDNPYNRPYLERLVNDDDDEISLATSEFHLGKDGIPRCHLTINMEVEIYKSDDVSRHVGVDLGLSTIYCATVVDGDGEVKAVEIESGDEYNHHRRRLENKKANWQQMRNLEGVRDQNTVTYHRYTKQVMDTCSREIVDLASEHAPCAIRIEDLTGARESTEQHDWPYADLQKKIIYKARDAGIPIDFVDAYNTSTTCRRCSYDDSMNRPNDDHYFECLSCGYEIHADVNAAINIANDINSGG